jgi:hypothetical protein
MGLIVKQLVRTNIYGTELWINDKTGAYNASTNVGGWGAPNPTLAHSALLSIVKRTDFAGDAWLVGITPQVVHNPVALDTFVNAFGYTYLLDGHHTSYLVRLRVSDNGGTTDLDAVAIVEGEYFAIGTEVYQRLSGVSVLVPAEDYPDLLVVDALVKSSCEIMFYNKLWIKVRDLYKQAIDLRNTSCMDEAAAIFMTHDELKRDIASADYAFRSGLKLQAESIVKTLLEKFEIV